ncbi:MAG TPA: Smr/MutS family protein [Alphaproteobacteria bacterium]|nr:Smr/MutS family protein [Alphaproteobacteria bacterium]
MADGPKTPGRPADDDTSLWRQVTGNVKPLRRRPNTSLRKSGDDAAAQEKSKSKPEPEAKTARGGGRGAPRSPLPRPSQPPQLAPGAAAGLDKRTAQRLRRGQIRIEGRIDLHGMTQAEAHANLSRFITSSAAKGRRCVLVITGKGLRGAAGTGVLRAQLPLWLNDAALRPLILSFAPAQPKDGGGGAFYVYLRKARE